MLYVLFGEDDYSLQEALAQIKRGAGAADTLSANTTILDGRQVNLAQLKVSCETIPFLAEKRLVIVHGLLERFERRNKTGQRKARSADQKNDCQPFASCLNQIPDFTIAVLVDGSVSERNPLFKEIASRAKISSFPLRKGSQLQQWLRQRVEAAGGSISPRASDLMVRLVGGNLWTMASEVDKLLLFVEGRTIEEEDVRAVVSYAQEANVFAMVDALLEFRAATASQLLQQLLEQGAAPAYLLVMLSRQVEIIVRVKELMKQHKSRGEIQNRLGVTSDYVLRKAMAQAERYSLARLKEVYHRLLEADLSLKTGRYDGELALSLLLAELMQGGVAAR